MSSDNKILSQVSQVIIKLLVAKIIIKVLFFPVTPVTARSSENTVDKKLSRSWSESNPVSVLGRFSYDQCCVLSVTRSHTHIDKFWRVF